MPDARERPSQAPDDKEGTKQRLRDLMELARTYRGWSLRQLADELDRDVHNLVPGSGVPKLDLVRGLAEILEWSVQDVSDEILGTDSDVRVDFSGGLPWVENDRSAYQAHCDGRWTDLVKLGMVGVRVATTGDERARSWMRLGAGWEGKGRFTKAMHAVRSALRETDRSSEITMKLRNNLAQLHYLLGQFEEAYGISTAAIEAIRTGRAKGRFLEGSLGFAHHVRANCLRVFAGASRDERALNAGDAIASFNEAIRFLEQAAADHHAPSFAGLAQVSHGGRLEMQALVGEVEPESAVVQVLAKLDEIVDPQPAVKTGMLESYGWWCVFGANIALRQFADDSRVDQLMGIFTNKADEIAECLDSWALRERVWSLELARQRQLRQTMVERPEWVVDADEVRSIVGAMGRFPAFRETGWEVLRSARVAGDKE